MPVIKEENGIPKIKRVTLDTLTEDVRNAATQARAEARTASESAQRASAQASNAQSAAEEARTAAENAQNAMDDLQEQIDAYLVSVDQETKKKIAKLGQMADTGQLDVRVESYQLFDDFVAVTGYTGTYEQFLAALLQGGGTIAVDTEMSSTSTNPVQNKAITVAMAGKQDTLEFLTSADINAIVNL